jgi:hypothetical protein
MNGLNILRIPNWALVRYLGLSSAKVKKCLGEALKKSIWTEFWIQIMNS